MHLFLAIIFSLMILASGFVAGITVPRWVRWNLRSPLMLAIWISAAILAIFVFWIVR